MRRLAVTLLLLALWPAAAAWAGPDLAVGQVWSIKASPPSAVRVVIGQIDAWPDGRTVVSVSLVDVPTARGPVVIAHLPFERAALVASLDTLVATGQPPPPQFAEAYRRWRADPEADVFTAPVADILAAFTEQMRTVGR